MNKQIYTFESQAQVHPIQIILTQLLIELANAKNTIDEMKIELDSSLKAKRADKKTLKKMHASMMVFDDDEISK